MPRDAYLDRSRRLAERRGDSARGGNAVTVGDEAMSRTVGVVDPDVAKLHQLGYAQELRRRMGGFSNFAISFTIISILSGCLTLYGYGLTTGGPVTMVWGWLLVGVMTTVVGLGMAEVCSAYPTAGGLYYWAAKLAKRNGAAWSWFTGWFNMLGQVAITAGIDFGMALFLTALLNLTTGFTATRDHTVWVYAGILLAHGLLNTFGIRVVAFLSDVSVWWHVLGVAVIALVLLIVPTHHASASFLFTHFVNKTGFSSGIYVFLIGLLMAQYTFTGYDASAHVTEETKGASTAGPKGIVNSIIVSLVAGFVLILGITYAITNDYDQGAHLADRGSAGADLHRRDRPPRRRAVVADCDRRPVLLRHGVGHRELADDLCLQSRRRGPRSPALAPDQPPHPHAHELDLVRGRVFLPSRTPLHLEPRRLLRGHLDRDDRPVPRVRDPDVSAPAERRRVREGPVAPRALEPAHRLARRRLGVRDHDPLHAPRDRPVPLDLLEYLQLRADRRRCRPRLLGDLLARERPEVVHRTESPR